MFLAPRSLTHIILTVKATNASSISAFPIADWMCVWVEFRCRGGQRVDWKALVGRKDNTFGRNYLQKYFAGVCKCILE